MKGQPIPPLVEVFGGLSDWREASGKRYELGTLLTLAFPALLSGKNSVCGMAWWVKEQRWRVSRALGLKKQRVPGDETLRTMLGNLDIAELEAGLQGWARQMAEAYQVKPWPGVASDGKTYGEVVKENKRPSIY